MKLQGSLFYHPKFNDREFSELIWKRKFDNRFEYCCRFQGVWVFHSKELNEVLVLLKKNWKLPIKGRKGWSEFQVWCSDEIGMLLRNILKKFDYPK